MTTKKTTKPFKFIPATFDGALFDVVVGALKKQLTETTLLPEDQKPTWQNALEKASEKLLIVPSRMVDGRLVLASDSGNVYAANRDNCQCTAFVEQGDHLGCWHRAAFVIVNRYQQTEAILNMDAITTNISFINLV